MTAQTSLQQSTYENTRDIHEVARNINQATMDITESTANIVYNTGEVIVSVFGWQLAIAKTLTLPSGSCGSRSFGQTEPRP